MIIVLTLYAPIELTRIIVVNEFRLHLSDIPHWQFILELCFFWGAYIAAMVITGKRLKRR